MKIDKSEYSDRDKQNILMREKRRAAREIEIPKCKNPKRRKSCEFDLELFCLTYMAESFRIPFSPDHIRIIKKIQRAAIEGGLLADAVFRGFGKTTLSEAATSWAVLYGHRKFVVFVGSDIGAALSSLESIQGEMENNELLLEDFPEACCPVHELEGITHRCRGQMYNGKRTHISWKADKCVFATIPGSKSSGSIIIARGITGRIRGLKHKLVPNDEESGAKGKKGTSKRSADGNSIRPDWVVIDDPQTDESANSPSEVKKRINIIHGAILGLAGHKKSISAVLPCTIIKKNDLADQLTDNKLHPEWQGERVPMVRRWADLHDKEWLGKYAELRREDQATEGNEAAKYYAAHPEMDIGCVVSWEHCYNEDETSALQHACNLLIDRGEMVFCSEYQLEPQDESKNSDAPTAEAILGRMNRLPRGVVPAAAEHITAFIDVMPGGKSSPSRLCYIVIASELDFTASIIDYGEHRGRGTDEENLHGALEKLITQLNRAYIREDGIEMHLDRVHVDNRDETDVICRWAAASMHKDKLCMAQGQGRGIRRQRRRPGERYGEGWILGRTPPGRPSLRQISVDVNHWKTFCSRRLMAPPGTRGTFSVFGENVSVHRRLAEQLSSEYPVVVTKNSETYDEWNLKPGRENHWWDCLVGATVALSVCGCVPRSEITTGTSVIERKRAGVGGKKDSGGGWFSRAREARIK